MKEKKLTAQSLKKAQQEMGKWYGLSFIASLMSAFVLSHVMTLSVSFYDYPMLSTGLNSAFWMWLGFVFPVQLTAAIFGDKNWKLLKIDSGYQLASLLVMGAVLGWM
jgi:hypothetical protein